MWQNQRAGEQTLLCHTSWTKAKGERGLEQQRMGVGHAIDASQFCLVRGGNQGFIRNSQRVCKIVKWESRRGNERPVAFRGLFIPAANMRQGRSAPPMIRFIAAQE